MNLRGRGRHVSAINQSECCSNEGSVTVLGRRARALAGLAVPCTLPYTGARRVKPPRARELRLGAFPVPGSAPCPLLPTECALCYNSD